TVIGLTLFTTLPLFAVSVPGCTSEEVASPETGVDRAYYILPPGNYGGLPTTENSLDQLPLYDGLTPLRADVTDEDIEALFLPEDFTPIGETTEEPTGREGTTIVYDEYGVAHITGVTRADMAFGAGWVSNRDRSFLLSLARGPARAAVADIPGIDAFALLLSAQTFNPSPDTEQLVDEQVALLVEEFGEEGEEIIADAQAYADGLNAWDDANGDTQEPWSANDVVAITAFIGQIFGAGGGSEATNANLLAQLVEGLGAEQGRQAWDDAMLFDDPEAPTSIDVRFDYPVLTGGEATGSVELDAGSIESLDAVAFNTGPAPQGFSYPSAGPPRDRQASNFLLVSPPQSTLDRTLAVMGPQLGYYYPEIVMQVHLRAPGIEAQGAAVPGLAMYLLLGRTQDYAWSLTSANHDVRDVFAEILCNPDGSEPTRASLHYEYNGECRAFEIFEAGTLNGNPVSYPVSVHGQMIGTATSDGRPVALTRQRSTFGRDGLNLKALKDMTEGEATSPEEFWRIANQFGFTFNWAYASRTNIGFFSSGRLPVRPAGLDRRLPTLGTGAFDWEGFLAQDQHPHAVDGPSGRILNWNNQAAPGFMHGDGTPYGSIHRVLLFDQFPERVDLAGVTAVMNRAATEDVRSPAWPAISDVLRGSDAPTPLAGAMIDILDEWVAEDAPQLDADDDGNYDTSAPTIMDALFPALVRAAMNPVYGELADAVDGVRSLGGNNGASLIDKDLRTLLGQEVEGPFNLRYCGGGDLEACRASLWQTVDEVGQTLATEYGGEDPAAWLKEAPRTSFLPNLIRDTIRRTNRPTFQQVLEFAPTRPAN
ncbi:MAG: penicillin acylase family protein, partial [Myxococcota bacterium]